MKLSTILHSSFQETQKQRTEARDCLRNANGSWTLSGDDAEQLSKEASLSFLVTGVLSNARGKIAQIYKKNRDDAVEGYESDIDDNPLFMPVFMVTQYPRLQALRDTALMLIQK